MIDYRGDPITFNWSYERNRSSRENVVTIDYVYDKGRIDRKMNIMWCLEAVEFVWPTLVPNGTNLYGFLAARGTATLNAEYMQPTIEYCARRTSFASRLVTNVCLEFDAVDDTWLMVTYSANRRVYTRKGSIRRCANLLHRSKIVRACLNIRRLVQPV